MPRSPATRRASAASSTEQHPCLFFPDESQESACGASTPCGEPRRMKTPITSYPSRSKSAAATELSTPPLIATTTFLRGTLMTTARSLGGKRGDLYLQRRRRALANAHEHPEELVFSR